MRDGLAGGVPYKVLRTPLRGIWEEPYNHSPGAPSGGHGGGFVHNVDLFCFAGKVGAIEHKGFPHDFLSSGKT